MTPDRLRLATTVALALGCAALGYAEYPLLPEVGWFAAAVVVALAVFYRVEPRMQLLDLRQANRVGGAIGVAWLGWAAVRVAREYRRAEFTGLGWPLFIVCLCGMLILAVIPGKLLRRDKHAGDYWQLFACGLGAAVLAGSMTDDAVGFGLIGAYALAAVWALAEFHAGRAAGRVAPVPGGGPVAVPVAGVLPVTGRAGRLPRSLLWAGLAAAVAVPAYLVTPRSPYGKLDFVKERVEIGYAADQMVDLTRTGELKANTEEAFTVRAESGGRPAEDLPPGQRWRGAALTHYRAGGWRRDDSIALPTVRLSARNVRPWQAPDFGPDRLRLTFAVPARLKAEFLADPPFWVPGLPVPVADLTPQGPVGWFVLSDGSFLRYPDERRDGPTVEYVQYTRRPADPDLGPPFLLGGAPDRVYVTNPVGRVKSYSDEVVRAGVAAGRLPAALAREPAALPPQPQYHEAIAREFARHLSEHPELRYTTNVKRANAEVDPVEDFLFHSRAGHCERFASALVLMLRSQAIPAVLVLGFRGCEHAGGGKYVVRQEFAHAWAEALISRPPPRGVPANRVWHWLSLDPSPAELDDPPPPPPTGLLGFVREAGKGAVDRYLLNYTRERRDEALEDLWAFVRRPAVLGGAAGAVALAAAAWAALRFGRRRTHAATAGWYDELLAALAVYGLAPAPGQTPREFAAAVGDALRADPTTERFSDKPAGWVARYYDERYGGRPAPPGYWAEAAGELAELSAALTARGNRR